MSSEMFKISKSALAGLREAAQRGTLIPFVGAGASRLAGGPDWNEFADKALSQFVKAGKFSHAQIDQLKGQSPRVKLSIALGLQDEHEYPIKFKDIFHPDGKKDNPKGLRLYGGLSLLGKTFVTTNYDEWLDEGIILPADSLAVTADGSIAKSTTYKRNVIHSLNEFIPANLNIPNTVIHLHGSILDHKNMIITTRDYIRHYANDRSAFDPEKENRVLTLLEYLFTNRTILFIGYGLEELEIIEYIISKGNKVLGKNIGEAKHFIIQGFFSHQIELINSLKRYYLKECEIELIPFYRDEKDWDQLLDVVEDLAKETPASDLMYLQDFQDMEGLLNG